MQTTKITAELEQAILQFYSVNTARSTAKYFHIRPSRLNEILAKNNVSRRATIKSELTGADIVYIIQNYSFYSDLTLCKKFHITKNRLYSILAVNNIVQHTETENRSLSKSANIENKYQEIIAYYTTHNLIDTSKHFHTNKEKILKILDNNNICQHTEEEITKIKSANQSIGLLAYFAANPEASKQRKHGRLQYCFTDNRYFDSSWELALWIYAKDHNEAIIYEPCALEYTLNNRLYHYFPDFLYKDKLIEIKGDHMLKDNKLIALWQKDSTDKLQAKQQCIEANMVEIWAYEKIKFALDYVMETYGKDYLKQFLVRG